ncbi:MAG: hypothetical protein RI953_2461 [Pseudomonadota bacterium]|jgi:hypothetical protein
MHSKKLFAMFLILASTFAHTGCVSKADVSNNVNAWIGADVDELVSHWGPPHQTHVNKNSTRVFQYSADESGMIPITTSVTTLVNLPYSSNCKITFVISPAGKVLRAGWKGDTDLCHRHTM